MIEAGILEGDTVLIKKTEAADTGDIVVALIDEEEPRSMRFRAAALRLRSSPPTPPTRCGSCRDAGAHPGKMVGLFRRY